MEPLARAAAAAKALEFNQILYIGLNIISGGLTAGGINAALQTTGANAVIEQLPLVTAWVAPYVLWSVCITLSALIQMGIVSSWQKVLRHGFRRRPTQIVTGLAFSCTSAVFAASTLMIMVETGSITAEKRNAATAETTRILNASASHASDLAWRFEALRDTSQQLARTEAQRGGTCLNERDLGGRCGPRCRWRQRVAARMDNAADAASAHANRAGQLSIDIQAQATPAQILEIFRQAHAAQQSENVRTMSAALNLTYDELRNGFVDPETNTKISCVSPELERHVEDVRDAFNSRPDLPINVPTYENANLTDSFSMILGALPMFSEDKSEVGGRAQLYLWAAFFAEALLVFLLIQHIKELREKGLLLTPEEEFARNARPLSQNEAETYRRLNSTIENNSIRIDPETTLFVVPAHGSEHLRQLCQEVIYYFNLHPHPVAGPDVPLGDILPEWWENNAQKYGNTRSFELYPLLQDVNAWRRRVGRDLNAHDMKS